MENTSAPEACRTETMPAGLLHKETPDAEAVSTRMAALRSAVVDSAVADRDRTLEGLGRITARLEQAKKAFDDSVGGRLDKSTRSWAAMAQAAYAQALDEADAAAEEGRRMPDYAVLAPAIVFHALAGRGVIAVTLGPSDLHGIEFRRSPGSPILARGRILASRGRNAELQIDAESAGLPLSDRGRIEKAVEILLDEPWRLALSILLDRCRETSVYAALAADHRAAAQPPSGGATD